MNEPEANAEGTVMLAQSTWLKILEETEAGMIQSGMGDESALLYAVQMVIQTLRVIAGTPNGDTQGFMDLILDQITEHGSPAGKAVAKGIRDEAALRRAERAAVEGTGETGG
jgi:hypothetical protein